MWNKFFLGLALILWSSPAHGAGLGSFTFLPKGGASPFEATCFDNIATARLMTWKEFQEKEFENRLELQLGLQRSEFQLKIDTLSVKLEEATFRLEGSIQLRDEEIEDLRKIIKKDRKVNIPLVIAGSVIAGIALGIGSAYAIDKALN
jgi:hypothetical protein